MYELNCRRGRPSKVRCKQAREVFPAEAREVFPAGLYESLGICRQSSSGLGLFVKEAVCVTPPFVTKVSCSFDMPMIRTILIVCCNYIEGIYSPAEGYVEAGKGHIIKTRHGGVAVVVKSAELVGLFVEPSVYCKMILQHIRSVCTNSPNATASALQILAAFVRGANPQLLQQELQEICRTVSGNDVCSTLTHQCHLQLTVFVSAVVNKKEIDRKEVSYELFFILLHVIALTSDERIVSEAKHQMDVLATVQKLDTIDVLYRIHGLQVLEHLKAGSDSWTSHSSERLLLEALLNFSGPAFFDLIDTAIPILMTNADNKKDPELRLRIFSLISHLVLKPSADKKVTEKLQEYSLTLIQKAILPNCIWQAGRTAAAVRAAAMSCLWALLEGKIVDTKTLRDILPELHTQIVSCLDDHNQTTRLVTCKVLLKLLTACQDAFDADRLNAIYPELLKRMDDSSDEIRVITTRTFSAFFRCFSFYDADLYKLHLQALFKGLLIHLDDPAKDIQEAVLFALKEAAKVSPALLRGQLEEVRHKHRLTKYCDELVEHTELLMRNQLSLEERPSTG